MKGVTALVEALQQNETLQTLVLDTNSIGDEGAEILAKHLSSKLPQHALYRGLFCHMCLIYSQLSHLQPCKLPHLLQESC